MSRSTDVSQSAIIITRKFIFETELPGDLEGYEGHPVKFCPQAPTVLAMILFLIGKT